MPKIAHIAALWSQVGHPSTTREWSLARKIQAVAEARFEGFTARLTAEHRRLAEKHGLVQLVGFISSSDPKEFATLLRAQKDGGAVHVNVQLDDDDTPPTLAVKHWLQLEREAAKIGGLIPSLEMHRDCCTETPEKTFEIAARYFARTGRLLKINFDFSHFAVVKHLAPSNYVERLLVHRDLVAHSEQFHFRPFNGHHCQVPVTYRGKLTPEVRSYLAFVEAVMRLWRQAPHNRGKTLLSCPEMGPNGANGGGYNISGLPAAWPEAVVLREQLDAAWQRAASPEKKLP